MQRTTCASDVNLINALTAKLPMTKLVTALKSFVEDSSRENAVCALLYGSVAVDLIGDILLHQKDSLKL